MKENFIKNWKDELRSQVQPIVKAGKRKPTITIIRIGDTPDSGMMALCKEIGFIGDLYQIPINSGITQKDLFNLALGCETDDVWIEEPLPQGFYNPVFTRNYAEKGILTFLKSLNIEGPVERIIIGFAADGYEVRIGEVVLREEDVRQLEQMALLEDAIKDWKEN